MNIPFIKYYKLWLAISAITAVACLVLLAMWGLKPGIDFSGGSLLEISFQNNRPATEELQKVYESLNIKNALAQKSGEKNFLIRSAFLTEDQHQMILKELRSKFEKDNNKLREERFETIGAAVSQQLKQRSAWAILLVSLGIIAYVAYAFRKVSRPIASWQYGVLAIIALVHDLLLVMGVFAALGKFTGVEVDTAFVVALLTVLGYSVNDTIVVYDRIRENLIKKSYENFGDVVNGGLNETLMRSMNTTFTTLLPLFALYFFGGATIHYFTLALLIGIASGAYSSIFIASPLLVLVHNYKLRRAAA